MQVRRQLSIAGLCAAASLSFAQGDDAVNKKIIEIGTKQNQVMKTLEHVTKKIGHRLTASPGLQKSMEWTMAQFKSYGCTNVRLEEWGQWPVGFQRGARQSAKMIKPWPTTMEFTSASWTPGTDGPMRGPAVIAPTTIEEFNANKEKYKGAWMVSQTASGGGRNAQPTELDTAIAGSGILGRVSGSRNELVVTSGNFRIEWNALPTMRRITVRKSDMDSIMVAIKTGRECVLEFDMEQKFIQGPHKNANVVAEIVGTEKPDEVVIVSGHLDSWDGPGSQGALDNGTGISVALEAARILCKAGAKPKRTIRFILWTGEEQGLFGSQWYVTAKKAELAKISAVFVDDGGTNYQGGMSILKSQEAMLREARKPIENLFPDLPFTFSVVERMPRGGGSDHAPFNANGVPGYFWFETGRSNYTYVHHTQHDKFEQAIPEYLVQSSVNSAIMSYNLACAANLLPREVPAAPVGGGGGR